MRPEKDDGGAAAAGELDARVEPALTGVRVVDLPARVALLRVGGRSVALELGAK